MCLIGSIGLTGCAGLNEDASPAAPEQVALGSISGSNFGGHAPVVGAHIYVLQAGTSGYGGYATSLLTSVSYNSGFPTTANVSDPYIPTSTNGGATATPWYYITSDSQGGFALSGDYTCTPSLPVYLYAYGGTSAISPGSSINGYSATGSTVTLTGYNLLSVGQTVSFSGFTGAAAALNSGTYTVKTSTTSNFTISSSISAGSASGLTGISVIPKLKNNPNIVQLLVLGNCPTSGSANFSYLNYVYMNEVSTIAAAYSLSGFFSNSSTALTSIDAVHLSIPLEAGEAGVDRGTSPAWLGLQNATANAAVLYNIQGQVVGTQSASGNNGDGEGHVANSAIINTKINNVSYNGVVPQALINSLANVLAACVDSNSSTTTSASCASLFSYLASSVGAGGFPVTTAGSAPTDTATAAIDMAHNPGNPNTSNILALPTGAVPFSPTVNPAYSTDLMIGITWPIPSSEQSGVYPNGGVNYAVGSAAADASGNVWLGSYQISRQDSGFLLQYDHLGNQTYALPVGYNPVMEAFDSTGNLWVLPNDLSGAYVGVYKYAASNFNAAPAYYNNTTFSIPDSIAIDGNNNVYVSAYQSGAYARLNSAGTHQCLYNSNASGAFGEALDKLGNLWGAAYGRNLQEWSSTNCNSSGGNPASAHSSATITSPYQVAIDQTGNVWVSDNTSNSTRPVTKYVPGTNNQTSFTGGGLNNHGGTGLVIDGSGNVIVGTWSSPNLLTILNNSGTFLTTTSGLTGNYTVSGTTTATTTTEGLLNFTLDASGNLWSNGATQLHEYIGIATPVLTPLSAAVKAGTIAAKP
jgi:hypothetical protein